MKALFYVGYPLAWAPGGHEVQIRATQRELEKAGVAVAWLHHEDEHPPDADLIHYWGPPPGADHVRLARRKGLKVVCSAMVTEAANRPAGRQAVATWTARALRVVLGKDRWHRFLPPSLYAACDHVMVLNPVERDCLVRTWGVDPRKTSVIPNGVEAIFHDPSIEPQPFDGLVYAGYVCDVKNSVELARAAAKARVPILFIGPARIEEQDYIQRFRALVDGRWVHWVDRYVEGREMASRMRGAHGLVLASKYEGYPLVALEALACGKPVLLPDHANLRSLYGAAARYAPAPGDPSFGDCLRAFWEEARSGALRPAFRPAGWAEVGAQVRDVYSNVMA